MVAKKEKVRQGEPSGMAPKQRCYSRKVNS